MRDAAASGKQYSGGDPFAILEPYLPEEDHKRAALPMCVAGGRAGGWEGGWGLGERGWAAGAAGAEVGDMGLSWSSCGDDDDGDAWHTRGYSGG